MQSLLLIAHGSRRQASNDEVKVIAERLKQHCDEKFQIVNSAFLELAEPSIPAGIQQCVTEGATSIIVLPYFLNSGRHVTEDIPEIVDAAAKNHKVINISIASHLGASDLMLDVLVSTANASCHQK